jgi:hypothetical protein
MHRILLTLLVVAGITATAQAQPVTQPIKLFNGKDLTNFYTWLKPHGKNMDPNKVFTVQDGVIRVSGQEFGGITTEKEYEDYHLVTEFKWGEKTWAPREDRSRDSGILLHCTGADGAAGAAAGQRGPWMRSIECQMIEGGTGDIILVNVKDQSPVSLTVPASKRGKANVYDPKGPPQRFTGGRIDWWGRSPEWKDVKGFRGKDDVEKPVGEWNTLECIADGAKLTYILNGVVVNGGSEAEPRRGKLLFQSEGAELFFRRIDLLPLKK